MSAMLADVFWSALNEQQQRKHDRDAVADQLTTALQQARDAWPAVTLDETQFVHHLADVLSREENADLRLHKLHGSDLFLAAACAGGEVGAVETCDRQFGPEIDRALERMGLPVSTVEEIRQALREKLFVADPPAIPYVAAYAGRGRIGAWMRVIAVHMALKSFRGKHRQRPLDEAELEKMASVPELEALSPEQQHMKVLYQAEFKEAFRSAVGTLSQRDRTLLRRHYIEGQTIDDLGEHFKIHRATAARWINKAKETLIAAVRRTVYQQCRLDTESYESVIKLVRSQLDVSIRRLLDD